MTVPFRPHRTRNAIRAATSASRLPVGGRTLAGFENLPAHFSQEPTDHQGACSAFLPALLFSAMTVGIGFSARLEIT